MRYLTFKLLVVAIICLLTGLLLGYGFGIKAGVSLALHYGLEFVELEVDETMLNKAIFQYKNHIGGCLFSEKNASLYYDQGD